VQLHGPRKGDPWALADRAILKLLQAGGNDTEAWDALVAAKPNRFVFESTLSLLRAFKTKLLGLKRTNKRMVSFKHQLLAAEKLLRAGSKTAW
jgi:hypothetical protein